MQHASGSMKLASSYPSESGSLRTAPRSTLYLGTMKNSARPHGTRLCLEYSLHSVLFPAPQRAHSPQPTWWWAKTLSHAGPELLDLAHLFVAEDPGRYPLAVDLLDVGPAYAAALHPD